MNKYELNGLGPIWVWEADSEEEATKIFLSEQGFKSEEAFIKYLTEDVGVKDAVISWKKV